MHITLSRGLSVETNLSEMTWCASSHLLDAVPSSHRGSISSNKCSPRQQIQVIVLRRVGGAFKHVQHPLGDQKTTCTGAEINEWISRFHLFGWEIIYVHWSHFCVQCWMSHQQCWWRKRRQQPEQDSPAGKKVWDLHPSAPGLPPQSDLTEKNLLTNKKESLKYHHIYTDFHDFNEFWPEMALVTDMRGECRAGVTPHTVWYPTIPPKPKVVTIWVKAALGEMMPRARQVDRPRERQSKAVLLLPCLCFPCCCSFKFGFQSLLNHWRNGITE